MFFVCRNQHGAMEPGLRRRLASAQLLGVEGQLGAAFGEWRLDDMAKARATAKQQTEPALLMEQSVRRSARSLHVLGEVLGEAGGATCDEHGFTAPSEAKASFVGSGGTLGDFIVSLNGRYVKTAVMAPSAGWLALEILQKNSSGGEQVFHGVPIAKRVRHNLHVSEEPESKDLLAWRVSPQRP